MTLSMWLLTIILVGLVVLLVKFQQHTTAIFGSVLVLIFALGWVDSETLLSNLGFADPYCICVREDQCSYAAYSLVVF